MNIEITQENAIKALTLAPKEMQPVLKALFGGAVKIEPKNIMDRISSFDDILELNPPSPNEKRLLDYNGNEGHMISARAYLMLSMISRVLNEGWKPDWTNQSQYKWIPWFKDGGSGLSLRAVDFWSTTAIVGSRLCYKSKELVEFAATKFADIYRDFLTLN